ncbi:DUF805 domain-containing protein [Sandarakinorhabdus rubra]|uniref:DUF805 domain-containing protein n=1 Tax=Sandarakinorhabdus rubra TaxID=2672568 RepID=UPI0013DA25FE|nr:DUF805 domain-containing protein [Sandarakinorhabdus rubra]
MANRKPLDWALVPLQKYADFSGRASRPEYWWFTALTFLASLVGGFLLVVLFVPSLAVTVRRLHDLDRSGRWVLLHIAGMLLPVVLMVGIMSLSGAIQTGDLTSTLAEGSGVILFWAVLAAAVGLNLMLLYWYAQPGTPGPNRFGPAPEDDQPFTYS